LYMVGKRAVENVTNKYSKAFAVFLGLLYYPMQIIMEININNFLFAFCSKLEWSGRFHVWFFLYTRIAWLKYWTTTMLMMSNRL
jgi:hypothetical protein